MYREQERSVQVWVGNTRWERDHLEDPGVDGKIILTWTFNKWGGSEQEQVAGSCERGNETSGSIKWAGVGGWG